MEERIEKTLGKNERILWTGKPCKTKLMDEDVKKSYTSSFVVTALVCAALIAGYIGICLSNDIPIMWAVIAVILALGVLSVTYIFTSYNALGKIVYVLTNKRAIIWHSEDKQLSISRSRISESKIVTGPNGHDSLCIGTPACALPMHKLRFAGVNCVREEIGENVYEEYPVFYNIADAKGAKEILDNK